MTDRGDANRPDEWYLTAGCPCGGWIVIDRAAGPTAPVVLPKRLNLKCDLCGETGTFGFEHLRYVRTGPTGERP